MANKGKVLDLGQECVLFTGRMTALSRSEAQQKVINLGGTVANSCSLDVTLVVAGVIDKSIFEELTTKKLTWAEQRNIRVIGEVEFTELVIQEIEAH
ncbi:BRCT domain-containing protein [Lactiplantibacillus plantarum]|uniref:BRCT domain-containing protein n=1 Tax=Lactiplantibacillus plantarum TaxID=1590 RepID=UPI0009785164|nr:BRCT domain-containing protein [Lactiplantibacillus plantarum]